MREGGVNIMIYNQNDFVDIFVLILDWTTNHEKMTISIKTQHSHENISDYPVFCVYYTCYQYHLPITTGWHGDGLTSFAPPSWTKSSHLYAI